MEKKCVKCDTSFRVKPSHYHLRQTCSKSCAAKLRVGNKNPNYKNRAIRICQRCSKEYMSYDRRRKYCSKACSARSIDNISKLKGMAVMPRKQRRPFEKRTCVIKYNKCLSCDNAFVLPIKKRRSYCYECFSKPNPNHKCIICGTAFKRRNKKETCSKKCLGEHRSNLQKGDKSHRWKGGKTSKAMLVRNSKEYKEWRGKVFERDNYTCQECGIRGYKLNADHIKPFCLYPELVFDVDNGKTLCKPCHLKTPTWGYKAAYMKRQA